MDHHEQSAGHESASQRAERRKFKKLRSWDDLYARFEEQGIVLPHSLEIEQAVLGGMIQRKDAAERALDIIGERTEVFWQERHEKLYHLVRGIIARDLTPDLLVVSAEVSRAGLSEAIPPGYLVELTQKFITTVHLDTHAKLLVERYTQRELVKIAEEMRLIVAGDTEDVFDTLSSFETKLTDLSLAQTQQGFEMPSKTVLELFHMLEVAEQRQAAGESVVSGIPSGINALDRLTLGWQKSDLIIIAARPSMGKSGLALHCAKACVEYGHAVAFFSLEMSKSQLLLRLICAIAGVDMTKAKQGRLDDREWRRITQAVQVAAEMPVYIDDTPGLSAAAIRQRFRKLKARSKRQFGMIVVDYLQKMGIPADMKGSHKEAVVSMNSGGLKNLAKEMDLPVVALSQLSRELERRTDKRPILSDLRDSGSIEQDADVILSLYRPEYYGEVIDGNSDTTAGLIELIVGKQRQGPTGTVNATFEKETGRFFDREPDLERAEQKLQFGMSF